MAGAGDDDELPDFGLNHPDDLDLVMELAHVLSTYQVLPEVGGWLDQDSTWTDDILTIEMIKGHVQAKENPKAADAFSEASASYASDISERDLMP